MSAKHLTRLALVMIAGQMLAGAAFAQPLPPPSPAAIAAARELVELKGGSAMFDPVVLNLIEETKGALTQTNPQLSRDLTDVATLLRNEFAPRRNELMAEAAKLYAQRFTEQELKDVAAFYKSPTGRKVIAQEPIVLDETYNYIQQWAPRVGEEVMNRFRAEMRKKGHNL